MKKSLFMRFRMHNKIYWTDFIVHNFYANIKIKDFKKILYHEVYNAMDAYWFVFGYTRFQKVWVIIKYQPNSCMFFLKNGLIDHPYFIVLFKKGCFIFLRKQP